MQMLWLVPLFPLLAFIVLALAGRFFSKLVTSIVGVAPVGLSALLAIWLGIGFVKDPHPFTEVLWNWIDVAGFQVHFGLYLDALSLVMMVVVAIVSFLILVYSTEFMAEDLGYSRFFAYMNLFVFSMLILVLADNLLFFYVGWEGVSLCSYLLIGFWYKDPANVKAANKAFIVTRIGDTFLAIGFLLLFWHFGTVQFQELFQLAPTSWKVGETLAIVTTLLFLGGAVGKSAQLPLQTWLPDAMAGPTPVSALIHAATMVTAGVYLIARTHVLFELAPQVQLLVAIIGGITLLLAGCSALTQHDIKRVLAYSTMSQIGYMFLALGVGAWTAAIFHFMVHAFFKSLLFLCAGVVILAMKKEHDMFKMGGLWKELPLTFWTFLIGASALTALPWIDAGFYSKDRILDLAYAAPVGGFWLYLLGVVGAFITSLYTFRMVCITFLGQCKQRPAFRPGICMIVPLLALAIASLFGGMITIPAFLGSSEPLQASSIQLISSLVTIIGVLVAILFFWLRPKLGEQFAQKNIKALWLRGWGFDWLYSRLFVQPFITFFRLNEADFIDSIYDGIAYANCRGHLALSRLQTGRVRWYATTIAIGAILVLSIMVWT